ncbi:tRNA(Arg) A34 adenosine deaminase TadA [Nitrosomonas sp. Nm34]|nr:tRNA(Arg) A34 adenosine deaminase TadA [Nitrosomonas sp. Nm34]
MLSAACLRVVFDLKMELSIAIQICRYFLRLEYRQKRSDKSQETIMLTDTDLQNLRRCVELATEALEAGDEPFGSVLVAADGTVLAEDRNRVGSGDPTRHPEFELARWAAANMTSEERAAATVYTSGEHCPMCAAAHGWVGLGRIVYASSSEQLAAWFTELGSAAPPVRALRIQEVVPGVQVEGPVAALAEQVHDLHQRFYHKYKQSRKEKGPDSSSL